MNTKSKAEQIGWIITDTRNNIIVDNIYNTQSGEMLLEQYKDSQARKIDPYYDKSTIDGLLKRIEELEGVLKLRTICYDELAIAGNTIQRLKSQLSEAVELLDRRKTKDGKLDVVGLMDWLNEVHDFLESLSKTEKES